MPSLNLLVKPQKVGPHSTGQLPLSPPLANPTLDRVHIGRLACVLRCPPASGALDAVFDTGAPLTIFPRWVWDGRFNWKAGQDYDVCSLSGMAGPLTAQLLSHSYQCEIVRLRVPVVLTGKNPHVRLTIVDMVAQLVLGNEQDLLVLGLWGGAFEGKTLSVSDRGQNGEITASLDW